MSRLITIEKPGHEVGHLDLRRIADGGLDAAELVLVAISTTYLWFYRRCTGRFLPITVVWHVPISVLVEFGVDAFPAGRVGDAHLNGAGGAVADEQHARAA